MNRFTYSKNLRIIYLSMQNSNRTHLIQNCRVPKLFTTNITHNYYHENGWCYYYICYYIFKYVIVSILRFLKPFAFRMSVLLALTFILVTQNSNTMLAWKTFLCWQSCRTTINWIPLSLSSWFIFCMLIVVRQSSRYCSSIETKMSSFM